MQAQALWRGVYMTYMQYFLKVHWRLAATCAALLGYLACRTVSFGMHRTRIWLSVYRYTAGMLFFPLLVVRRIPLKLDDGVQVIYGLYSAVPPSLWFNPEQPLAFGLMACLVLGLSVTAATLFKGLLSAIMDAAQSGTLSAPSTPKQSDTPRLGEPRISHELIEMHARAAEVHSPMSSASAVST